MSSFLHYEQDGNFAYKYIIRGGNFLFYSIIIPVYNNAAMDVKRCINSIYQGNLTNFEILVIDDGSKDECANKLDNIIAEYPDAMVFHLSHGGAAEARNEGIRYAKGEYICFVDADDIVTKQFLFDLSAIEQNGIDYDIVYGLVCCVKSGSEIKDVAQMRPLTLQKLGYKEYRELYRHMFDLGSPLFRTEDGYISRGPVARIVKREIAQEHLFNSQLVLGEDEIWNLDLLESTDILAIVYHNWYLYRENPQSISRKPNSDFIKLHRNLLVSILPYMKKHKGNLEGAFVNRIFESLRAIIQGYYLTPLKNGGFLKNIKEFNKMTNTYPYTMVEFKNAKMGGIKNLFKFALLKTGCLLLAYKVKNILLGR